MQLASKKARVVLAVSILILIVAVGLGTSIFSSYIQQQKPSPSPVAKGEFSWTANHAVVPVTLDSDLAVVVQSGLTGSSCQSLKTDLISTKGIPPIPNSSLESIWKGVLSSTARLNVLCRITNPSGSQLASATNIASNAETQLTKVIDQLNLLKG